MMWLNEGPPMETAQQCGTDMNDKLDTEGRL